MASDVERYLQQISNRTRREDAFTLLPLMTRASGYEPYLTGTMIGFGCYHYKYDSGREGEWFVTGFAPRKQNLVVYIMPGIDNYPQHLEHLGKYKTGRSCLYLNKVKNIDLDVLERLIHESVKDMKLRYACEDAPMPGS